MADTPLDALSFSVDRLRDLTNALNDRELTRGAYPSEWSIADVLSHLGSGAVITRRRLDDTLAGRDTPDDYAPAIWDEWNAKQPAAQRDDALAADAALIARLQSVTAEQRNAFASAMGPITLDFDQFVAMRLNEHALHTWDIETVDNPTATIPTQTASLVVDNLELIAQFTANPTADTGTYTVATVNPDRRFTIELTPDSVTFDPATGRPPADLQLTAEAFVRLVYGRLDTHHTPNKGHHATLDLLREVFPGP